jgi:hypothetical protein
MLNRQHSIYDPYSNYGIYGRHNREYSLFEIEDMLDNTGFEIVSKKTLYSKEKTGVIRKILSAMAESIELGDYIIIKATKKSDFKWYFPPYLFRGTPKNIIINNFIRIGDNCAIQIGHGWHEIESWDDNVFIRWTKKQCSAYLRPKGTENKLYLKFLSEFQDFKLYITIYQSNSKICEQAYVVDKGWQELTVNFKPASSAVVQVDIVVYDAWIPKELGINEDARELGIAIRELSLRK